MAPHTLRLNFQTDIRKYSIAVFVCMAIFTLSAQATAQTVLTVKEAEYRSRWVGKQEDRLVTPQYFAPGGGLDEETEAQIAAQEQAGPNFVQDIDRMAENVKRGLRFGPLDFQLGLSNGWEYSSQNSVGASSDFADNNSFFAAPTIGITYEREIGVWTVNARFGTGYRYYFNQDYTAAGTGVQRNPLALTGGIDIGYNTSRLSVNLSASASSGSGYDITTGSNSWQTSAAGSLSLR
ncbi:MAG: hypothetical protein ACKOLA_13640, partial [Spartobacteria bacterium]